MASLNFSRVASAPPPPTQSAPPPAPPAAVASAPAVAPPTPPAAAPPKVSRFTSAPAAQPAAAAPAAPKASRFTSAAPAVAPPPAAARFAPAPPPAPPVAAPPVARRRRAAAPTPPAPEQPPIDVASKPAEATWEDAEQQPPAPAPMPHEKREAARAEAARLTAEAAANTTTAVARPMEGFGGDSDIDPSDLLIPRIHVVQKVGDLSQQFEAGQVVLNKVTPLPLPLTLVLLGFRPKYWVEKLEGGRGEVAHSLKEIANAGGTVSWDEAELKKIPLYQPVAVGIFALQYTEVVGDDGKLLTNPEEFPFIYEPDQSRWLMVQYSMKGTAYTNAAKVLFTARLQGRLRISPTAVTWTMDTEMTKFSTGNWAAKPILTPTVNNTPEFQAWLQNIAFGAPVIEE